MGNIVKEYTEEAWQTELFNNHDQVDFRMSGSNEVLASKWTTDGTIIMGIYNRIKKTGWVRDTIMKKLPYHKLNSLLKRIIYHIEHAKDSNEAIYWNKHLDKLLDIHYSTKITLTK